MCKCKNTNCGNDCKAGQPKSICDLTPSGDVYYDSDTDLVIGVTTVATKGDNLNDVLANIVNEVNNLHP